MRYCLAIFLVILFGCSSEHKKTLTLKDLKFPDPVKDAIIRNHVEAMTSIDTGWHFNNTGDNRLEWFLKVELTNSIIDSGVEVAHFDTRGNRIYYKFQEPSRDGNYKVNTNFTYDSLGFLVKSGSISSDSFWYDLKSDNNALVTFHQRKDSNSPSGAASVFTDTGFSWFDSSGQLYLSNTRATSYIDTTIFLYDREGKLVARKTNHVVRPGWQYKSSESFKEFTYYYYNENTLDSIIVNHVYTSNFRNYTDRYYFDWDGLAYKSILKEYYENPDFAKTSAGKPFYLFYRYKKYK